MIRLSLAAVAALALIAATNPVSAQSWGYGYGSYGSYNSYGSYKPSYNSHGYSRYGYGYRY